MLTAIAVLGTTLVGWSNSNLRAFESSLANNVSNKTNQINENVVIENVAFCTNCGGSNTKNIVNITLTNTGTVPVRVNQVQINSTVINKYYTSSSSLPSNIMPKNSYLVSASLPSPTTWASKKLNTITVTTTRGSIFTTQVSPP
jgi:hypothetical protein